MRVVEHADYDCSRVNRQAVTLSSAVINLTLMDQSRVMPVDNENESSAARVTKDGKQLTYHLKVLQQPIRARACGAGAKCRYLNVLL